MSQSKGKIIVTGGTGYIGSHTVCEIIEQGYEVIVIDNLSNSNEFILDRIEQIIHQKPKFYKIDVCDTTALDQVFQENSNIKGVIHFAAWKSVGESVLNPLKYYRNNIDGLLSVLEVMIKHQVSNIVFSSSCSVYGNAERLPVLEDSPLMQAESPYGNTKTICEEILKDVSKTGFIRAIALRYFNPVGSHESILIGELPLGVPSNLIPVITQAASGKREEMYVFGNDYPTIDGTCIRDYIHVVDLAKAHIKSVELLVNQEHISYDVFNIGTGEGVSVKQAIDTFEKVSGQKVPYKYVDRRAGDVVQIWADCRKANEILGWRAECSLEDSLLSSWKWQLELNKQGI